MGERCITLQNLELAEREKVYGEIFFEIAGTPFPSNDWEDFALVLTTMWLNEALKMLRGDSAKFMFMDGPYAVNADVISNGDIRLQSEDRHDKPGEMFEGTVTKDELCRSLSELAQIVSDFCSPHNLKSDDWADFVRAQNAYSRALRDA